MRIARVIVILLPLLLAACLSQSSAPSTAPTNFSVTAGENRAVLSWDNEPGLTYWVYYKVGSSVTTGDHDFINTGYTSPAVITGLVNGTTYYYVVSQLNPAVAGAVGALDRGYATLQQFPQQRGV